MTAVLALGLTLTSCGESVDDPADVYAAAVKQVRDADTGRFLYALDAGGVEMLTSSGSYSVTGRSQDATFTMTDGETARTSRRIDVEAVSFTNSDVDAGPCWLIDEAAPEQTQSAALRVLLDGKVTAWETEGSVLKGSTPLPALVTLLGELGAGIDVDLSTDEQVPFVVLVDEGKVTALKTDMGSVLRAVEKAGGTIPEVLVPFTSDAVEIAMLIGYSGAGEPVTITAPTSDVVTQNDDAKATKDAYSACTTKAAKK